MLVANSFDLWQKDAFFSAAEEVQQSADIMESAFRLWEKERSRGLAREDLDELYRELQTALGTAKWQLEEFDKAVSLSHKKFCNDNSQFRHKQFVAAMESQISRVEAALKESLNESGKEPLRWVHLNKEECDDLAMFLSGTSKVLSDDYPQSDFTKEIPVRKKQFRNIERGAVAAASYSILAGTISKDVNFISEFEPPQESLRARNVINSQEDAVTDSKGSESSPKSGEWKITISDDIEQRKSPAVNEDTSKEKRQKLRYWDSLNSRASTLSIKNLEGITRFNQLFEHIGGFRRHLSSARRLERSYSKQVKLALMLTTLITVPFLLY